MLLPIRDALQILQSVLEQTKDQVHDIDVIQMAAAGYDSQGRGAFAFHLRFFDEAVRPGQSLPMKYASLTAVQGTEYMHGIDLVQAYDPNTYLVRIVMIDCKTPQGDRTPAS